MLSTPVAFIIFNRPDTTDRVFQAIRQISRAARFKDSGRCWILRFNST
jgi:hypothetical protein